MSTERSQATSSSQSTSLASKPVAPVIDGPMPYLSNGITMRDFAAIHIAAAIASCGQGWPGEANGDPEEIASRAVAVTNALLRELSK